MKSLARVLGVALVMSAFFAPMTARADSWFACNVSDIGDMGNRVGVYCTNGWQDNTAIHWVMIGLSDANKVQRFWTMMTGALLSGKPMWLYLPTSASGNMTGCSSSNCRVASQFSLAN